MGVKVKVQMSVLALLMFLQIVNNEALASTILKGVTLDSGYWEQHAHQDYIRDNCTTNEYFVHSITDYYKKNTVVQNNSSYFSTTSCTREIVSSEYTTYPYGPPLQCSNPDFRTSVTDTGWECNEGLGYSLRLLKQNLTLIICDVPEVDCDCFIPPTGGTSTVASLETLTFILACKKPYIGKLLYIKGDAFYPRSSWISAEILPDGSEFLINGISPSNIIQTSFSTYNPCNDHIFTWAGYLYWYIPINVKCGEKITLTPSMPSIQNGAISADLSYVGLVSVIGLEIIKPVNNDDFDLTELSHTATKPINYNAHVEPVGGASTVDWKVELTYRTSGGKCAGCDVTKTFQSAPDVDHPETYTSLGGQATVNASAVIQGENVQADPVKYTITGVAIPNFEITNRLVSLYGGPTKKRLMTGLAMKESSYRQFNNRTLYGRTDLWPLESPSANSGAFIGLMQVATTMDRAWDWQKNTEFGVNFYQGTNTQLGQKMGFALLWEKQIKNEAKTSYNCQLRNLTGVERENIALVLYGSEAKSGTTNQYYYYQATISKGKTTCDWIINTQGNPTGVAYADDVRAKMQ
ncbi:MAG: hypothetical protein HY758_07115 [Nitrospirae bacterium]|nr:hypothetical protein [Nitrospirota bacterium]